jgi:regulator of replication initiation timing
MNIIKQLQAKNADLNAEVNTLSNEIHALKLAGAASFIDPETQNPQVRELIHKNQELLVELESLKERLAIYESTDRRDLHGMV